MGQILQDPIAAGIRHRTMVQSIVLRGGTTAGQFASIGYVHGFHDRFRNIPHAPAGGKAEAAIHAVQQGMAEAGEFKIDQHEAAIG